MMTLEEMWENLRQDPEIKATMEEVDKSYKLFKKIENLIVADLEAKLAESEKKREELDFAFEMETNSHKEEIEFFSKQVKSIQKENKKLKQQLAEKEKEIKKLTKSFAYKNNEDLSTTINGVKFTTEQIIALQQVGYSAEYDRNQTAIAELEKVKAKVRDVSGALALCEIEVQIDHQIKKLKGDADGTKKNDT